ncbi:MAG: triple tyrosine motif-containing protein [Bacteroidota bacterium]
MKRIAFLFIFLVLELGSQELPPIQNYAPPAYQGENQNWSISQSKEKLIYIANNKGLLEFNGADWTRYASPNETVIRSVKVVGDRIYTGSYREFGYWEKDTFGTLHYTSISQRAKVDFLPDEEFWSIREIENGILFQSRVRIYIYNLKKGSIRSIDSETASPNLFEIDENIYFQKQDKGIFKIEGGKDFLVLDDIPVAQDEVVGIFQRQSEVLILTRDNGFYRQEKGALVKWDTKADSLLSQVSVYGSIRLRNGSFALGTISHGLIHLDEAGNLLNHINQINGLRNNTVLSLFEDTDNNLWLGLDNGISYVNLKSPFRVYHDNRGVVGSVYATEVLDDMMYLGSNQGLFYRNMKGTSDFKMIPGTQGQVWFLGKIGGTLFCGHHTGTFVIREDKAEKIASAPGTWTLKKIEDRPDLLVQGNYDGLHILEKTDQTWKIRNKIGGFDHSSRFVSVHNGKIFVNHEYKGVFKIKTDASFTTVDRVEVDTIIRGSNSGLLKYKGALLYAYKDGVLKYSDTKEAFLTDSILSNVYSQKEYVSGKLMVDERNSYLWILTDSNISYFIEGQLDSAPRLRTIPLTENMRDGIAGYENITAFTGKNTYLFGNTSGYFTVTLEQLSDPQFTVEIGKVKALALEKAERSVDIRQKGDFTDMENNLRFSFYTPTYSKFLQPEYQYKLQGIYDAWSDLSHESNVKFENLPPGNYTFKVRSKVGNTFSSNEASYAFRIAPPWYLTNIMWIVYLVGLLVVSVAIHNLYKRYYTKRQEKLIEKNKRDMALAKAQSEKEIVELKNEQLKTEFQNKSNELAASTMSIIKKNELLSKAKEQLMANVGESDSVKPIIEIIDSNLNQSDDWELFKEAFNNADRKFLKKLKKVHPNLSPNDIKLCAYLRLNLSSKEIAPLLNISARSVEIKRYRLRKKMGLEHDANLVNYILKL